MTKDEMKDEMKNKISMALKDPVLQQGFEIICKNLVELEKEKCELLGIIQGKDKVIQELKKELSGKITNNIKKPVYNAEYRREQYVKHREKTLKKQKEYDDQHREEINRKARARYRAKCGLKAIKEAEK